MTRTGRHPDAGFTLFEIMIALAVLAGMMVVAWSTTDQTMKAKRQYEALQEQHRQVRVAMSRIVRDLSMAYISGNEDRSLRDPRTFFVADPGSDIDELRFTSFAHVPLFADANEGDQTVIQYYAADDPRKRDVKNLVRRETRRLAYDNESFDSLTADTAILFPNVSRFELEFWDVQDRQWKERWDTQQTDGVSVRVPERIRITLGYENAKGDDVLYSTQARTHISELVQGFAN